MRRLQSRTILVLSLVVLALACGKAPAPAPAPASAPTPTASPRAEAPRQRPGHPTAGEQQNPDRRLPFEVFAAASLRDVMAELGTAFEAQGRPRVAFNFAGSNVLAQQIVASSRGEIFISADDQWVSHLEEHHLVEPGTRTVVASNTLAVVAHPASTFALTSPAGLPTLRFTHLSVADPAAVPAGRYTKAYLESIRSGRATAWSLVEARVAPAADVRAALALVATQQDVVGIVYRTDARAANVRVLFDVPPESLPTPVRYTAVAVQGRPRIPLCQRFLAFLVSPEGQAIFTRHGFLPPPAAATTQPPAPSR